MNKVSWPPSYQRALFCVNSFLLFWYFSFSALGNKSPAILGLLLMSFLTFRAVFRSFLSVWNAQVLWILALLVYAIFNMVSMFFHGVDDLSSYERPAKALGAALIFMYLMKYRFSHKSVALGLMVAVSIGAGYAVYEKFYLGVSRAGSVTHPIRYGYLLLALALLCAFFAFNFRNILARRLYFGMALFGLFGAYCTGTRGIFVILFCIVLWGGVFLIKRKRLSRSYMLLPLVLVMVFGSLLFFRIGGIDRYVDGTISEVKAIASGNLNTSIGTRIQLWHVALYLGINEPLSGVGYDYENIRFKADKFISDRDYNPDILVKYGHFHNEYLDRFAKQGVWGLFVWCFFLVAAITGMKTHYKYAVFIIIVTLAVGGLTEAVFRSSRLFYLAILGISVFRCLDFFEQSNSLHRDSGTGHS